jgi:hypothetical protein
MASYFQAHTRRLLDSLGGFKEYLRVSVWLETFITMGATEMFQSFT